MAASAHHLTDQSQQTHHSSILSLVCHKCRQLVRAEDGTAVHTLGRVYHHSCFVCEDCHISVAEKFYVLEWKDLKRVVCEKHYTERLSRVCHYCGLPTTASTNVVSVRGQKYHADCIRCPCCVVKNASSQTARDNAGTVYFEYGGLRYCRHHYSLLRGTECTGCRHAIFNSSVVLMEKSRKWHSECYKIWQRWGIRLADPNSDIETYGYATVTPADLRQKQDEMEQQRIKVYRDLYDFEKSFANVLDRIIGGNDEKGVDMPTLLTWHVKVLFLALDKCACVYPSIMDEIDTPATQFLDLLANMGITAEMCTAEDRDRLLQELSNLICIALDASLRAEHKTKGSRSVDQLLDHFPALSRNLGRCNFKGMPFPLHPQTDHIYTSIISSYLDCINPSRAYPYFAQRQRCDASGGTHTTSTDPIKVVHDIKTNQRSFLQRNMNTTTSLPALRTTAKQSDLNRVSLPPDNESRNTLMIHDTHEASASTSSVAYTPTLVATPQTVKKESKGVPEQPHTRKMMSIRRALSARRKNRTTLPSQSLSSPCTPLSSPTCITIPSQMAEMSSSLDACLQRVAAAMILESDQAAKASLKEEDLIETKKESLWCRLKLQIRAGKLDGGQIQSDNIRTLGVPLASLAGRHSASFSVAYHDIIFKGHGSPAMLACYSGNAMIPYCIQSCVLALLQKDVTVEGIFRKNGNIRDLKAMCEMIDRQESLATVDFFAKETPIQLAAFLKRFLRELPEPLLPDRLQRLFNIAEGGRTLDETRTMMHLTLCLLPKPHRDLLELFFLVLNWIAKFSAANKMDLENLARIMAPTVLHGQARLPSDAEISAIKMLIQYQHEFCTIPADIQLLLQDHQLLLETDLTKIREKVRRLKNEADASPSWPFRLDHSTVGHPGACSISTQDKQALDIKTWIPGINYKVTTL